MMLLVHYGKHGGECQLLHLCLPAPVTRNKRMVSGKRVKWQPSGETPHPSRSASPRAVQLEDIDVPAAVTHLTALSDPPPSWAAPGLSYDNLPTCLTGAL